ncbi:hypothetical protein ACPV5O_00340 [Vibrio maritimus]|uniref:hypothetical protein n=1 Tax=Vibrio maritimus TaxID=990268 RepID=UPI004067EB7C
MAYLPFYLTPEEFDAYQEEREKEIRASKYFCDWSCNNVEKANRYTELMFAGLILAPAATILGFCSYLVNDIVFSSMAVLILCILGYGIYLGVGADTRYQYIFSELGLVQKKNQHEPKWVHKVMTVSAGTCAVGSLFAVITAGPMALAGTGVLMFLTFGMMKRQPINNSETTIATRDDWLFAHYNTHRKVIQLFHKFDNCSYEDVDSTIVCREQGRVGTYLFTNTVEELIDIVEQLSSKYALDCIEVNDHKHIFSIEGQSPERLLQVPARANTYAVADTYDLKANNAPLPNWEYMYSGKWVTEQELSEASKRSGSLTE